MMNRFQNDKEIRIFIDYDDDFYYDLNHDVIISKAEYDLIGRGSHNKKIVIDIEEDVDKEDLKYISK